MANAAGEPGHGGTLPHAGEGFLIQLLPLILNHDQARNMVPLVFIPYLLRRWWPGQVDWFFKALMGLVALGPVLWATGLFIQGSWTSVLSPLSYAWAILGIYSLTYSHTDNPAYSGVLALHAAASAGYLYEVPRYIELAAGVLRFNRGSFFTLDYSIISIAVVVVLLLWKGWTPGYLQIPFVYLYLVYCRAYLAHGPFLWAMRRALGISAFRAPALILVFGVCLFYENN